MVPNLAGNSERSDLVRGLALWSATAMSSAMPPARAVGSATCFRGMDHRWITVLLGAFCHAELGAAFPKAGALRLSQPGSRPFVGISRCLDELASRAASGYGHAGDRV